MQPEQPEKSISWDGWLIRSLVALIIGAVLAIWHPLWLKPPIVRHTFWLYLPLAWSGVITLIVAAFHRPTGKRWGGVWGIVVHSIVSVALSAVLVILFAFAPYNCSTDSKNPPVERYACTTSFFYKSTGFTFIGITGIPLMLHIQTRESYSGFG